MTSSIQNLSMEIGRMEGRDTTKYSAIISYEGGNREIRFHNDLDYLLDLRKDAVSGLTGMMDVSIYVRLEG